MEKMDAIIAIFNEMLAKASERCRRIHVQSLSIFLIVIDESSK
jgi:hypothetical protein